MKKISKVLKPGVHAVTKDISAIKRKEPNYFRKHLEQLYQCLECFKFEPRTRKTVKTIVGLMSEYYGIGVKVRKAWFSNKIKISFEMTP